MRYERIDSVLFEHHRQRFMRKMQPDSLAIFFSNDQMPKEGNIFYPFRQNPGLFYLCGIDQPETVLVLFPDCAKASHQELLFIKRTNPVSRLWEGDFLSKEESSKISGIQKIYWLEDLPILLHELIIMAKRLYVNTEEHHLPNTPLESRNYREAQNLMQKYPVHKYHRSQPILRKLMMIKHPIELQLIQKAVDITGAAFQRVMHFLKPGVYEYEIEAEVTHEFIKNRASGHAYPPIIASGGRSCILHYSKNQYACRDGELLLMDIGAEYANYASDITRVFPVNGQFTPRQKAVYNAVLKIMREAQQMLVPGTLLDEFNQEVGKLIESALIDLKVLTRRDISMQNPAYPIYKRYCMHSISHHIGLGVHDLSNHYDPVMAGMLFTCEPAIYLPEEGFGIRLENNFLVTDQGPHDLSQNIPIEVAEIEALMNTQVLS